MSGIAACLKEKRAATKWWSGGNIQQLRLFANRCLGKNHVGVAGLRYETRGRGNS
ncbi:hypothetical protein [Chamaesiphon polymorphus]|uniref:hypothetical protein n=1 Tax=Chamaesiphon polymorphus TaxID=2107691 RepID=UPI0015E6EDEB|nr:hypothetical protein [Chamaesiphon polymorphus]